jgi:hypothetical protein
MTAFIPAKQTMYRGCLYRAQIEARWAAFFDLLEWPYEYEPFMLRGWIPDFLLMGEIPVLVEVKPFYKRDQFSGAIVKARDAIRETDYARTDLLFLGCSPMWNVEEFGWGPANAVGILFEDAECEGIAALGLSSDTNVIDFCHDTMSYRCRISGEYNSGCISGWVDFPMFTSRLQSLWQEAGNIVRWMPKGQHTDLRGITGGRR